eukprot:CAMPEP_0119367120 /NCGR_PEP_ID=MMETSP1334-20130426/13928_1 /TAXON_ID=127549 /ORGANISM="Calcidiscus leptoporus, Strain RCC1130" /LENGTH=147 /DNA_ID=CAMNT_0007383459 /DNA_START=122 /DNA_END=565 /DNA_ORIENTATION=-
MSNDAARITSKLVNQNVTAWRSRSTHAQRNQNQGRPAILRFVAPYGTSSTSKREEPSCDGLSGEGGGSSAALWLDNQPGTTRALAWMTDGKREVLNGSLLGAESCWKLRSAAATLMATFQGESVTRSTSVLLKGSQVLTTPEHCSSK